MEQGLSLQFVSNVRRYLEASLDVVWESQCTARQALGSWKESNFSDALILHGLCGRDTRTGKLLTTLGGRGAYSLEVSFTPHSQQVMEPITGADFAVLVKVLVDGDPYQEKVFLVQLKCGAVVDGSAGYPDLHHYGGNRAEALFGSKLHQAERMLFFTPASVYWLSVPTGLHEDADFYTHYARASSFSTRALERGSQRSGSSDRSSTAQFPMPWFAFPMHDDPRLMDVWEEILDHSYFWRRYWHEMFPGSPRTYLKASVEEARAIRKDAALRALRQDASAESRCSRPGSLRYSVAALHAESVLALSNSKATDLASVFGHSVSLPEFILGTVVADGFGDENEEVIQALTSERPTEFMVRRIRHLTGRTVDAAEPPTGGVLNAGIEITREV